jgi:anhydro-N-acetylmuramic acid kinase
LFQHATKNRVLLNLGGIANVTVLPAGCGVGDVMAFDTGPANMVIDACMQSLYGRPFDKSGTVAAKSKPIASVVTKLIQARFFSSLPPKSCGREEFGAAYAARFISTCKRAGASREDVIATATALTMETILDAHRRFCWPHLGQRAPLARGTEMFVAGGGAKNKRLMRGLSDGFAELGVSMGTTVDAGFAIDAKEAAAFALLGWLTWHGLPGNVPSATGASRAVVLGKVTQA